MEKYFITLSFLLGLNVYVYAQHPNADTVSVLSVSMDSSSRVIQEAKKQLSDEMKKAQLEFLVIKVSENQYGYYILIDGHLYIEQKIIPAISGNQGFSTEADAEEIAQLVIEKIKEGEIPPSLTQEEIFERITNNE